jgi:metal-responsive CopG/Arc/MetJ family transcriptional regulator
MANPFFSGRIPQPLADKVDAHLTAIGQTRSELLLRLLRQEVGDNETDNNNKADDRFTDLLQRVEKLEQIMTDNKADNKPARKPRSKKVVPQATESQDL